MRYAIGALALATATSILGAAPAVAADRTVNEFPVAFTDVCGAEPVSVALNVRLTNDLMPNGAVHFWLDIKGTVTNDDNGRRVLMHAARRFIDEPAADATTFHGLQVAFSAPGAGVIFHNSGWASGALSEALSTYDLRGHWDSTVDGLPEAVCGYLFD